MQARFAISLAVITIAASVLTGCRSPYHADQGALWGGLTGAGIGAAIGEHNDNPIAGAIIGGAVGSMAGAAVGEGIDADIARNNALIQRQLGRRLAGAVTLPDVIAMSQAGLGDEVIVTHIRANGVAQPPQVGDLIALKDQGVSERVINALQQQPPIQTAVAPQPVVVQEHHVVAPYYPPYHRWHSHHHHRPRHQPSHVSWGFSFGR